MDRLKIPRFVKKAGLQVPAHIRRLMRQRHPTVQILWHTRMRRWALVQLCRGHQNTICFLSNAITLANTVQYLDRCHPSNFRSKGAIDTFLSKLDENPEIARVERNSRQMIADGSKDIFNVLSGRRLITKGR